MDSLALASLSALSIAAVILIAATASVKIFLGLLGGMILTVLAFASGNPRLFSLWGLMLTIPFDLSKRFGPVVSKLGGETAFRVEVSDPFLVVLLLFLIRDIWRGDRCGIRIPKVTFVWLAIALLGCLTILWGPWGLPAAHEVVRMLKLSLLFIVVSNELTRPGRFLHAAAGLTLSLMIQSTFGLVEYFMQRNFGLISLGETSIESTRQLAADSLQNERVVRAGAFMIHPNIFGISLAIVLPVMIGAFLVARGKFKLLFISGVALGMPALIVTYSRSSWVAFALNTAILMVLLLFHQGLRRRSMIAALMAMLVLGGASIAFAGPIFTRIFESKAGAMIARAEFDVNAYELIALRPWLGWGLNSYALAVLPYSGFMKRYAGWIPVTHNGYLLWTAETGFIGLSLHLLVIASLMWTGFSNLRVKNELLFAMNAACLSALFGLLVDERFSPSLRANPVLRLFWILAGIILAIRYYRLTREAVRRDGNSMQVTAEPGALL